MRKTLLAFITAFALGIDVQLRGATLLDDASAGLRLRGSRSLRLHALLTALLLALGGVLVVPVAASAAEGDVGFEGPSHSGTGTPTGTKRATSSLWFNDGLWWGNLWDTASSDFHIFRFNAATSSWVNTGVVTDKRASTHHDVLWDGTTLYVVSYRFVADNLPAEPNFPTTMRSYSYNSSTKTYSLLSSTNINNYKVETLTIDKDSTGRVWATWQQGNKIYLNVTGTDGTTWGTPFPHPASLSNVSVDDTSAVIAFGPGKMGLMWSREVGDATDGMYWSDHVDGASNTDWSAPVAAVSGPASGDDHMNLKWLDSSGGRVFAAVKTSFTAAPQPLIQLLALNGTTWSAHTIATVSECPNRVIVLIDESTQRLRTFATYPKPNGTTNAGVCSNSGGAIYEKSSPLDNINFTTATKTARIVDADQYVHNVTSTKQNLNSAARGTANSGLLVLADVNATSRYWHFYDRAPVASFTATPTSGTAPLDVAFTDTSTDSPTSWSWAFGDGDTSTAQNPAHTYTAAGTYTATLTATNGTGSSSTTSTITVSPAPPPVAPTLDAPSVVNVANVDAVPVSGTARARPADTVSVTASDGAGNAVSGTATASSTGAWSLPTLNLTSLNDGTVTLTATATDTAGNVSPATTATVPKDTVPPAAPTLDAPSVVNVANVDAVPVSGTAEAGATVSLNVTDTDAVHTLTATATADGTGYWSLLALNLSSLNDGTVTLTATATDTAGNVSPATTAMVPKDTVPPAAPTLDAPSVVNVANVDAVPVSGTAGDAGTVSVTASDSAGHTVSGTATASSTGAWSLPTLNLSSLNDGTVTLTATATATDTAGNVSPATTATVPKDTAPPAAPTLDAPSVVNVANVDAVPVSGTAGDADTMSVTASDSAGHTVSGPATASSTGAWSLPTLNLSSLNDGTVTLTATATDTAGNVSPATTATVPKDTAPPAAPTLTAPATVTAATATSVTVSGSAEAGTTVTLNVTDANAVHTVTATATADGTGNWSMTALNLTSLSDGQLTYTATATDTSGNTGASAAQTGTKKTTATAPQFTSVPSQITGDTVTAVPFAGTSDPGAAVALTATDSGNHSLTATATANGSGNWSAMMNLSTLNSGPVTFSAQATDTYGNISTVTTATSRIGPRVVSVTLQNGGTAGKADTNDKVVVAFNEPMSPSSFCNTWTSTTGPWTQSSNSVSVLISRNTSAPNDTLTLSTGCTTNNFGTVNLGAHYTTSTGGNLTFKGTSTLPRSSVSLSADGKTLTITLGALKSGTRATGVPAGTPTYQGTTSGQLGIATDTSGVPLGRNPSGSGTASRF
ncbi:Ig-like domain-containing protein [Pseudarthrobacter sulfonivorans]|nr:Ig-like domain-containing protein [Pseudarthrobacter sulfonivorans]